MLGDIFEKSEKKEVASIYYSRIVKEYPLSSRVGDAKGKLVAFHVPVPQADPKALAWMQAEVSAPRPKPGMLSKPMSLVKNGPEKELRNSSHFGNPQMEPETDTTSAADILTGGGKTQLGAGGGSGATGNTAVVEVATPQSGASGGSTVEGGDTGSGAAPAATGETTGDTSGTAPPAAENPPAANTDTSNPPAATTGTDTTGATGNGTTAAADPNAKPADNTADPQKESTSKKKKGLKKIIPW